MTSIKGFSSLSPILFKGKFTNYLYVDLIVNEPEEILKITRALSVITRLNILKLVSEKEMNVTELSEILHMTKANVSMHIAELENAGLIEISYKNGIKGIKKVIKPKYDRIIIDLQSGSSPKETDENR